MIDHLLKAPDEPTLIAAIETGDEPGMATAVMLSAIGSLPSLG